jgi:hypothetical protein
MTTDPHDAIFRAFHNSEVDGRYDAHLMVELSATGYIRFTSWFLEKNTEEQARLLIEYLEKNYRYDLEKGRWVHMEQKT